MAAIEPHSRSCLYPQAPPFRPWRPVCSAPPSLGTIASKFRCIYPGRESHSLASFPIAAMHKHLLNRKRRHLLTGFLLAMLLFRAYVPIGFMPASGVPFLVELCPATTALSMPMHSHHQHSDTHSHFENCPFGSLTAAGPLPAFGEAGPLLQFDLYSVVTIEPIAVGATRIHLPQPRGPPFLV